ncbi:MAG: hypothetical protein WKG01_36275, partial [Kofleriaceae bacterium]
MSARGQVVGALALAACASSALPAPAPITPAKVVPPPAEPGEATRVRHEVQDPIRLVVLKLESEGAPALGIAVLAARDERAPDVGSRGRH